MTETQKTRRRDGQTPRVDRRAFVRLGVAGGVASLVAACGWDGGGAIRPLLLDWSRVNDWVGPLGHGRPRRDDVHGYEAGGVLGRPGVPMVRRDLAETTARPSARTNATARVRRNQANDASSRSRERNATNPPNASPPAERIGLARPIRCSPPTSTEISLPPESPARRPSAAVSAASAGPTCSRGSVLPTT